MSDPGRIYGRGIAFPPRLGPDGRVAWSAGDDSVRDSIRVILQTERRERLRLPDFGAGLGRYLFEPNTVATRHRLQDSIAKELAAWEPRVAVDAIDVQEDPADAHAAVVTIEYRLVATQAVRRMTLGVQLGG